MDSMDYRGTISRLAHLKAIRVYEEMQDEGLTRDDLPKKLQEIAAREEEAVMRLAREWWLPPVDTRLLLQLAIGDEQIADLGCEILKRSGSMMMAIAAMTVIDGDEYELTGEIGPN